MSLRPVLAALLLCGVPALAQDDAVWPPPTESVWGEPAPTPTSASTPEPTPWGVVPAPRAEESGGRAALGVTLSGAISLGSYQAGQAYAFTRALAGQNRRAPGGQNLVVTGSSAGSINALLVSMSLSTGLVDVAPHRSPFFRTWIPIGFNGSESSLDAWRQLRQRMRGRSGSADLESCLFKPHRGARRSVHRGGLRRRIRSGAETVWSGDVRLGFQVSRLTPGIENDSGRRAWSTPASSSARRSPSTITPAVSRHGMRPMSPLRRRTVPGRSQ